VPPRRLHLKDGVTPEDALDTLRNVIAKASEVTTARDPINAAINYVNWAEMAAMELEGLTAHQAVLTMLETPRFWHIRRLEDAVSIAPTQTMIDTELSRQTAALQRLMGDLEKRVAAFEPARVNSHPPLPRDSLPAAMSRRQIGIAVALVGVVAALIAALANPLGIGDPGWGWKQTVLLVVGIVLAICGGVIALRSPSSGTGVAPPAP
jgi:hypothetical protein